MSKPKLRLEDLPTLEQIQENQLKRQMLLRKRTPNAEQILAEKLALSYQFLFQNFPLLESQDRDLVSVTSRKLGKLGFVSFVTPILLNIGLGKMTGGYFFELPRFLRIGIRFSIYAAPVYLFGMYARSCYEHVSLYMVDKYMDRIEIFMKYGDPKIINPYFEDEEQSAF
jgi:hypothetical protein